MVDPIGQPMIGACLGCRYRLEGLKEDRCPECGRDFDLNDPKTVFSGRVPGTIGRMLLAPPGSVFLATTVLAFLGLFASGLAPGGYTWIGVASMMLMLLLIAAWSFRVSIRAISGVWFSVQLRGWREFMRWLIPITILVGTIPVMRTGLPLRIAFTFNKPALDRFAKRVFEAQSATPQDQSVGMYTAKGIQVSGESVVFVVAGTDRFIGQGGFAYFPAGLPADADPFDRAYQHLSGPWYTFTDD